MVYQEIKANTVTDEPTQEDFVKLELSADTLNTLESGDYKVSVNLKPEVNFAKYFNQKVEWKEGNACNVWSNANNKPVNVKEAAMGLFADQIKSGALTEKQIDEVMSQLACVQIEAPLNWADPNSSSIHLGLLQHKPETHTAEKAIFINPGGPGGVGTSMLYEVTSLFKLAEEAGTPYGKPYYEQEGEVFNIIGFDPRGVGLSSQISCEASDSTPYYPDRMKEYYEKYNTDCIKASEDNVALFADTQSSARDLDLMRSLTGNEKLNYHGMSWGTTLGENYLNIFPSKGGNMVLDSPMPADESVITQRIGVNRMGEIARILDQFVSEKQCGPLRDLNVEYCPWTAAEMSDEQKIADDKANLNEMLNALAKGYKGSIETGGFALTVKYDSADTKPSYIVNPFSFASALYSKFGISDEDGFTYLGYVFKKMLEAYNLNKTNGTIVGSEIYELLSSSAYKETETGGLNANTFSNPTDTMVNGTIDFTSCQDYRMKTQQEVDDTITEAVEKLSPEWDRNSEGVDAFIGTVISVNKYVQLYKCEKIPLAQKAPIDLKRATVPKTFYQFAKWDYNTPYVYKPVIENAFAKDNIFESTYEGIHHVTYGRSTCTKVMADYLTNGKFPLQPVSCEQDATYRDFLKTGLQSNPLEKMFGKLL
jgi:pimeloyl-ACP methyl ester carboxylesterase